MNYQVVGWTYYDDDNFPDIEEISIHLRDIIIEDIKKNHYLFTSWRHQEDFGVPVLNTKEKVCFSRKGFAELMLEANGLDLDDFFSLANDIQVKGETLPDTFIVDEAMFKDKKELIETHKLNVLEDTFSLLKQKRVIDLDLASLIKVIDKGDFIIFKNNDKEYLTVIKNITYLDLLGKIDSNKTYLAYKDKDRTYLVEIEGV